MSTRITLALIFFQQLVRHAKRIVVRCHEHAALQIDHGVGNFALLALIQPLSGMSGGKFAGRSSRRAGPVRLPSAIWK